MHHKQYTPNQLGASLGPLHCVLTKSCSREEAVWRSTVGRHQSLTITSHVIFRCTLVTPRGRGTAHGTRRRSLSTTVGSRCQASSRACQSCQSYPRDCLVLVLAAARSAEAAHDTATLENASEQHCVSTSSCEERCGAKVTIFAVTRGIRQYMFFAGGGCAGGPLVVRRTVGAIRVAMGPRHGEFVSAAGFSSRRSPSHSAVALARQHCICVFLQCL